jgi:hypothetical protein
VADLHVLEDLRDRQAGRADQPRRGEQGEQQHPAAAELQPALPGDHSPDVRGVLLTPAAHDLVPDGVELDADALDVLGREVGDRAGILALDRRHARSS